MEKATEYLEKQESYFIYSDLEEKASNIPEIKTALKIAYIEGQLSEMSNGREKESLIIELNALRRNGN